MKKTLLYAAVLAITIFSCKDDDETPTFKKENLIADWNLVSTDMESDCDNELLEIDDIEVTVTSDCGAASVGYDFTYNFDGKNTVKSTDPDMDMKFVILQLNSTTLKIDWYFADMKAGTSTYQKL